MIHRDEIPDILAMLCVPITDDNVAQFEGYLGAFEQFLEKDPKYNSVWKEAEIVENIGLSAHKCRRMHALAMSDTGDGADVAEEAYDAVNYAVFAMRQATGLHA